MDAPSKVYPYPVTPKAQKYGENDGCTKRIADIIRTIPETQEQ
jgi:hypothetical protein